MTTAWVTTLVATAAALAGHGLLLILTLVAQTLETQPVRSIDVTLSRYAFSPERIEVRLGERIVLNVRSLDGAHGLQVKELGLNARVAGARAAGVGRTDADRRPAPFRSRAPSIAASVTAA